MKRFLSSIALAIALLFPVLAVSSASAVNVFGGCSSGAQATDVCQEAAHSSTSDNPVIKALRITIQLMAVIIGLTAVIILIISGINMSTSGGDPQKVANARNSIIYALIGIAVAALAETIVAFVLNKL